MPLEAYIPLRTKTGLNSREHPLARKRRVEGERAATALALRAALGRAPEAALFPVVVELTRVSPRSADLDNVVGGLKAVRDELAAWLGVDDGDQDRVRWLYRQAKGPFGVRVAIHEHSRVKVRIVPAQEDR